MHKLAPVKTEKQDQFEAVPSKHDLQPQKKVKL